MVLGLIPTNSAYEIPVGGMAFLKPLSLICSSRCPSGNTVRAHFDWRHCKCWNVLSKQVGTTKSALRPLRMDQSLRDLPTNMLREDPLFASDLSAVLQDSGIELVQNQANFTVYVEGLEKLFHAGSLKEDEKARKGHKGVVEVNQFTKTPRRLRR